MSLVPEDDIRGFSFSNTDIIPVQFIVDVEISLVTRSKSCGKVVFFNAGCNLAIRVILPNVMASEQCYKATLPQDFADGCLWQLQLTLWAALLASPDKLQSCMTHREPTTTLSFANVQVLLEFLVPGVNGYADGWFYVKLCAKCTTTGRCYRLFLRQLHNTQTALLLWVSHFQT
jgi:hypothetical protein